MRILAWDDEPEKYMEELKKEFDDKFVGEIYFDIEPDTGIFLKKMENETAWDLFILDLVRPEKPNSDTLDVGAGAKIAKQCRNKYKNIPIFFVTGYSMPVLRKSITISNPIEIYSKELSPQWLFYEMIDELKKYGLIFDPKKVFLIYGRDRTVEGTMAEIKSFLLEQNLKPISLEPSNLNTNIQSSLIEKMNDSGAFIAICTPDDKILDSDSNEYYQPRQNVLFEMGIGVGLARGMDKLIIIQKWDHEGKDNAILPSDFGGILTLQFKKDVKEIFHELTNALHVRKISIK